MNVYFDESGDLGWTFNKPYGSGGSSRYLTIAFLFVPPHLDHLPRRIVKHLYRFTKTSPRNEIKGKDLSTVQLKFFVAEVQALLASNPGIKLAAITVKKENVDSHIRTDQNLIYNYMTSKVIPEMVKTLPAVTLRPDPRTIKVGSVNSLRDYLQTKLWFEMHASTVLSQKTMDSKDCLNLQFIDIITHIVWASYERGRQEVFSLLNPHLSNQCLFFHNYPRP
jgi:hypothetical protein